MEKTMYEGLATIRSSLEDTLARMLALKRKEGEGNLQLRELVTEASVMFVDLRRVNREILQEEDRRKSETEAAKAPVDHTTLQLHNLLYEKNYYLKAIKGCKDFKSKYPDIDLVPEQEFFRDAPEEHRADPALHHDPHKLMLQRLNFELHQRKELLKQREFVEARKKLLQENITSQRKFLGSLLSHLKGLKKASLPLQQQLGLSHAKRMKQHTLAELLPPALYIVYTQLLSHKEAFEEALELEIVGSAKDAITLARQAALKDAGVTGAGTDEVKAEEEVPEDDDDSQRRRKRVKRTHEKEIVEEDSIYQSHPLAVIVQIFDNEQKMSKLLTLRFEFLTKINVLCAGVEAASSGGCDSDTLLANLFPDDTGVDLPNQISKLQAGPGFTFDKERHSRPYKWVQHLGGIDILPESPPYFQEKDVGGMNDNSPKTGNANSLVMGLATYRLQHRVSNILHQLRVRRKAQLALKEQLDSLAKLKHPFPKSRAFPWIEYTPKATFRTWAKIDHTGLKLSSSFPSVTLPHPHSTAGVQSTLFVEAKLAVEEGLISSAMVLDGEAGKEDGELPSSGMVVSPSADATKAATDTLVLNEVKDGVWASSSKVAPASGREASKSNTNITGSSSKGTSLELAVSGLGKVSGRVDIDGWKDIDNIVSGDSQREGILAELGGLNALMDEDMGEAMLAVHVVGEDPKDKAVGPWMEYGMRTFRAIFRRENGPSGKCIQLEAQVDISLEYPVCAPLFQVRLLSEAAHVLSLPAAPGGVLHVTEGSVSKAVSHIDHSFNNLRAIEAEVNITIPQLLPVGDKNETLSHQIAALMMLFDIYVDSELGLGQPSHGGGTVDDGLRSSLTDIFRVKVGNVRPCRGRDRRKPLPWVVDNISPDQL